MPILNRTKAIKPASAAERAFDRYVKRAARLLDRQPDLDEDDLTRLLAARERVDEFETCAAAQLAFFRREAFQAYLCARDEFAPGARRVA
jgi:hypothetical protein